MLIYVLENLREMVGVHTCDQRSDRHHLQRRFPDAVFEEHFSNTDALWSTDERETAAEVRIRASKAIIQIMSSECTRSSAGSIGAANEVLERDKRIISITSHSGLLNELLVVLGHPTVNMNTGSLLPLILQVQC